ncbi:major facilitator superfamily domain-containing protein [Xylariaceae sp. FL1019]|nr:major facilitator superfamily domain-containing protein [Xylariaceae sp. FL1019]
MARLDTPQSLHDEKVHAPPAGDNSSSTGTPSSCCADDDEREHDGHRPCGREMSRVSSHVSRVSGRQAPSASLRPTLSRRDTTISRIRSRPLVPAFTHPLAHAKTTEDVLVDFEGPDDPYRPINWPTRKKVITTVIYGLVTGTATWASSSFSAGNAQVADEYHVSDEVAILGTSLFLVGFGLGPLLWAPLSEVYGRRTAVLTPMFVALVFSFATATAKDLQTILITRFFGAFFASAPVTNTGGVMGDLYTAEYRGIAIAGYAMAVVGGPSLGPIVSSAVVVQPWLGWRWTQYLTGILQSFVLLIAVIFIDETYPPALLVRKARRLRHETGNWALHAKFEEWDWPYTLHFATESYVSDPLFGEMSSNARDILRDDYMQLGAIPFIFREARGWGIVVSELPFIAIFLGAVVGAGINVVNQLYYNAYRAVGCRAIPEKRLPPMMLGAVVFASGQFITAWTAEPENAPWIAPVIGLFLVGTGFFTIFQAALNYLVDTFTMYAASAIAANTFLRSCFATAFPLIIMPIYRNIGIGPGASIFAAFSTLLLPVPFVFYIYGRRIRAGSKWSKPSVF